MCCRCNRNRGRCRRNCQNTGRSRWTDTIPTRRILVNDLEALQNRAGGCGCCNCGCGCDCEQEQNFGRSRDCEYAREAECECSRGHDCEQEQEFGRSRDCGYAREAECECSRDRDCNRDRDCGNVELLRDDDIEFANVFNNHCSCSCRG